LSKFWQYYWLTRTFLPEITTYCSNWPLGNIMCSKDKSGDGLSRLVSSIGVARGAEGSWPSQMFRIYSHFVLWEAFFSKQNSLIRLKSSILDPPNFFVPTKYLVTLRHWSLDGIFASLGLEGYSSRDFSFVLQKNGFKKFLYFNDFLFVVFVGKKQTENVGKIQKFEKKTQKWWRHFKKISVKCINFEVSVWKFKSRVPVWNFKSQSRSFWWTLVSTTVHHWMGSQPFLKLAPLSWI